MYCTRLSAEFNDFNFIIIYYVILCIMCVWKTTIPTEIAVYFYQTFYYVATYDEYKVKNEIVMKLLQFG